ncbi:Rz1-like lysis system protein LysC [Colwellia sp. E150_009]
MSLSLLLLSGCLSTPETKTVTLIQVQKVKPPQQLIQPCLIPVMPLATNQDLIKLIGKLYQSISVCNFDKQLLRDWTKDQ